MQIQDINKAIEMLDQIEPLAIYSQPHKPEAIYANEVLAKMYADEHFRNYLRNEINIAMNNASLKSVTLEDIAIHKSRILTLKELLMKSKHAFERIQLRNPQPK